MNAFAPHLETLPDAQRRILPHFRAVCELGFVLYGGTALALRLGHRVSIDFDFFCERPLDRGRIESLPILREATIFQDEPDALGVVIGNDSDAVKISFFGEITFGRVGTPQRTTDGSIDVASIDDLFATKLKVLLQRVEAKDYLDIVALIESGASLERSLGAARSLYGRVFEPAEALRALTYFEAGDLSPLTPEKRRLLEARVAACGPIPEVAIVSRKLAA